MSKDASTVSALLELKRNLREVIEHAAKLRTMSGWVPENRNSYFPGAGRVTLIEFQEYVHLATNDHSGSLKEHARDAARILMRTDVMEAITCKVRDATANGLEILSCHPPYHAGYFDAVKSVQRCLDRLNLLFPELPTQPNAPSIDDCMKRLLAATTAMRNSGEKSKLRLVSDEVLKKCLECAVSVYETKKWFKKNDLAMALPEEDDGRTDAAEKFLRIATAARVLKRHEGGSNREGHSYTFVRYLK
jgi:hypothetical protein